MKILCLQTKVVGLSYSLAHLWWES